MHLSTSAIGETVALALGRRGATRRPGTGLRVAPFEERYLDDVLAMINHCAGFNRAVSRYTAAGFRRAHRGQDARARRSIQLLLDGGRPAGLALLVGDDRYRPAGLAFLEVLYIEAPLYTVANLQRLLATGQEGMAAAGLRFHGAFTFVEDESMAHERELLTAAGFAFDRYSSYLTLEVRDGFPVPALTDGAPAPLLPDGYRLERVRIPGNEAWIAAAVNRVFESPTGVPVTPEDFHPLPGERWLIPEGMLFLYWREELIGCAHVLRDFEGRRAQGFIARLGVVRRFRRRGLGRQLLRAAVQIALAQGYRTVALSAYSTTPAALRLYEQEGFRERHRLARMVWRWA